jgi:hypothetical protein
MLMSSISSLNLSSLQKYQTVVNADARPSADSAAGTADRLSKSLPKDRVELSQEGRNAYASAAKATAEEKDKIEESPEYRNALRELAAQEDKVIAHEQAHMAAGGDIVGAATYSYTVGPDKKRYISGGEVSISVPETSDKEQMLQNLERVKEAALAPAEPSGQDLKVAADADAKAMKLRSEIAAESRDETQRSSVQ